MAKRHYEIDMINGPLLSKILQFAFPMMLSGILQLLFNAADIIVVGRFSGKEALAAVGATSALTSLLITVFVGLSVGTNVLVAKYIGARDTKNIKDSVHTSITVSILCGVLLIFVGFFLSEPILKAMGTPSNVLDKAAIYMKIYFASMPGVMLYNFGSAVLRAVGDTKRPLYYLTFAGVINVICNLFFVIILKWGVEGVATATAISQMISGLLVLICLIRSDGVYSVEIKDLNIKPALLWKIIKIGLPAGLQGALFSISNVLIQSSVNTFGSVGIAGSAAAGNIEGFIWISMDAFYQADLCFTSQNIGAKKYSRINKIAFLNCAVVTVIGTVLGVAVTVFSKDLINIYNSDLNVIEFGARRLLFIALPSAIGGIMDVLAGSIRGLGYSILPTVVSLTGACGLRVIWIFTVFAMNPTPDVLFFSYPATWTITALCNMICLIIVRRKLPKADEPVLPNNSES